MYAFSLQWIKRAFMPILIIFGGEMTFFNYKLKFVIDSRLQFKKLN